MTLQLKIFGNLELIAPNHGNEHRRLIPCGFGSQSVSDNFSLIDNSCYLSGDAQAWRLANDVISKPAELVVSNQ